MNENEYINKEENLKRNNISSMFCLLNIVVYINLSFYKLI